MSPNNIGQEVYLAWLDAWLSTPWTKDRPNGEDYMTVEELASSFQSDRLADTLHKGDGFKAIVLSFRHRVEKGEILLGGSQPPSRDAANMLMHRYDPRTKCSCTGAYPVPQGATVESLQQQTECAAIRKMLDIASLLNEHEAEWNPGQLFTADDLRGAVTELALCNTDEQGPPETCIGQMPALTDIQAPDRRPNPMVDTDLSVFHQMYPTNEKIKLLTDAKYFFAIAAGAGHCDESLTRAVAEAANNILIADYCDAADERSLATLQEVGASATAFVKLSNLAGTVTDWQFNNSVAQITQFSVLGYHRDHSRARRPGGIYGSRMTGVLTHRYIDLAIYPGLFNASIGLGESVTREQYRVLTEACVYINDLADFRSDSMRKLRENVVLCGVRGNLCRYLDVQISSCLRRVAEAIRSSPVLALVVMALSNWMLMASQHKVYELLEGIQERSEAPACEYLSASDGAYAELLEALSGFGTLGERGPSVHKRRANMDFSYYFYRKSSKAHTAWLADSTRALLHPRALRKMVDVVHYSWSGEEGDVEYCP